MPGQQKRTQQAVIYLRVASASVGDPTAIDRQHNICRQLAKKCGLTIAREYVDVGRPARLTQQPELQRLLSDLDRLRDAGFVIVPDYARLVRDMVQMDEVTRRIRAAGAEVATPSGVEVAERFIREQNEAANEKGVESNG